MQKITATITRRNIGNAKIGAAWENVIKAGRRVIGSIFEPCQLWPGEYHIEIRIAPGYMLKSVATSMPDAVLEFYRLTDSKYTFNA